MEINHQLLPNASHVLYQCLIITLLLIHGQPTVIGMTVTNYYHKAIKSKELETNDDDNNKKY